MDYEREIARIDEERANFGRDLVRFWDEGRGDVKKVGRHAKGMATYMRNDADVARLHLAAVERVAAGPVIVPEVHRILFELYARGTGVDADPAKAVAISK